MIIQSMILQSNFLADTMTHTILAANFRICNVSPQAERTRASTARPMGKDTLPLSPAANRTVEASACTRKSNIIGKGDSSG